MQAHSQSVRVDGKMPRVARTPCSRFCGDRRPRALNAVASQQMLVERICQGPRTRFDSLETIGKTGRGHVVRGVGWNLAGYTLQAV
jgi:hypothetical protein